MLHLRNIVRLRWLVILLILFFLNACRNDVVIIPEDDQLPCKVEGACDPTVIKYMNRLRKRGVKVITIGQDYLISIPARALFANQSARLEWSSYDLLNEVTVFLKQFRKIAVTVTSYCSKYVSVQRERALTLARSRVVSEYIGSRGIDTRFIFTQGLGSDKPIVTYLPGGDASANARVEITFRNAVR